MYTYFYADDDEESDEDAELPSYLREQSSDEEDQALYSQNKKNAQGTYAFTSALIYIFYVYMHICRFIHLYIYTYIHSYLCW
jgi:hypothetical protein